MLPPREAFVIALWFERSHDIFNRLETAASCHTQSLG